MKAYRVIEYDGPEDWVRSTLAQSLDGMVQMNEGTFITATVIHMPKVISRVRSLINGAKRRATSWPIKQVAEPKLIATPAEYMQEQEQSGQKSLVL